MQVNHTKKLVSNLKRATVIRGKWNGTKYHVIHKLGEGACGVVYLCERNGIETALKLGTDSARITTEVNVLKSFQRVQGKRLGPSLLDVDDWVTPGGITLPFYVMEYVKGQELATFLHGKGSEWLGVLLLQLLMDLGNLHESGWVFGDLKTDNLLVTSPPPRLRLIDVGGTTQIGRAIKEYTEFYDRGYWLKGSRKAEPSYDLFAVTMIMLEVGGRGRFERGSDPRQTLERKLQQATALKPFTPLINNVWAGNYQNGLEMREDLVNLLQRRPEPKKRNMPVSTRTSRRKKTKKTSFATFEIGAIFVSVIIFYLIYMLFFL
ncbi:protein kinase domain-containing protein [Thalassobacillus pellis]|uniref:protein kinase domain-containing protein n=1 Tax=Thalassobacillus pellis TaxID=748008 RepID=UPI001961270D|nr:serine/threonine-protein kinase [Thalassobacillus pellis]MBM7555142.1 serine/threonine-protein kinase [Thalassobacillus pellis]